MILKKESCGVKGRNALLYIECQLKNVEGMIQNQNIVICNHHCTKRLAMDTKTIGYKVCWKTRYSYCFIVITLQIIKYKGKRYPKMKRSGGYHLNQVIKLSIRDNGINEHYVLSDVVQLEAHHIVTIVFLPIFNMNLSMFCTKEGDFSRLWRVKIQLCSVRSLKQVYRKF